jgi:hypothetical protein
MKTLVDIPDEIRKKMEQRKERFGVTFRGQIGTALEIYFTNPGKDYGKTIKQK